MKKGDCLQASEKYWGAVAQMIKFVAAKVGIELGEHKALWNFISDLDKKYPDQNLWSFFEKVRLLHMNFYENEIPEAKVKEYAEASRELIARLQSIVQSL